MAKSKSTKPAKKPAKTPKVSPLKGTPVPAWAAQKLSGEQRAIFDFLRQTVKREAPEATNVIKWAQPIWELNGPFAWARASAKHFSFGFWRGADLADPNGLLEGDGDRMKHVKLRSLADAKRPEIAAFVREAAKLNRSKGDPTKR